MEGGGAKRWMPQIPHSNPILRQPNYCAAPLLLLCIKQSLNPLSCTPNITATLALCAEVPAFTSRFSNSHIPVPSCNQGQPTIPCATRVLSLVFHTESNCRTSTNLGAEPSFPVGLYHGCAAAKPTGFQAGRFS